MRGKKFITFPFRAVQLLNNGVTITYIADLYYYRAYLETLLIYGYEAAESHLTNAFWYRDTGDPVVCDRTETITAATNRAMSSVATE